MSKPEGEAGRQAVESSGGKRLEVRGDLEREYADILTPEDLEMIVLFMEEHQGR
jgi:hypothetical protein